MRDVANVVERLERDIPQLMERFDIPGMAVGVCDATQVLWACGFGTTRRLCGFGSIGRESATAQRRRSSI